MAGRQVAFVGLRPTIHMTCRNLMVALQCVSIETIFIRFRVL